MVKNEKISKKNIHFFKNKIDYFMDLLHLQYNHVNYLKTLDLIGINSLNNVVSELKKIHDKIHKAQQSFDEKNVNNKNYQGEFINQLQEINNDFFSLFKDYGSKKINDILYVCFGNNYLTETRKIVNNEKLDLLLNHTTPIGFKIIPWTKNKTKQMKLLEENTAEKEGKIEKELKNEKTSKSKKSAKESKSVTISKNTIIEDIEIVEKANSLECFDMARTHRDFYKKVHGIKVCFQNSVEKKTLLLFTISNNIDFDLLRNPYIDELLADLNAFKNKKENKETLDKEVFEEYKKSLTLKDLFIYSNDELIHRFNGYLNQLKLIKFKSIDQNVKEFLNSDIYLQRKMLIQLLISKHNHENQYLAYLLYDLLSNDNNGFVDSSEQNKLYNSLPWTMKKLFNNAMKTTIEYTNVLANFNSSKIPLEQRICLMKANDNVKEKAMTKLKELKSKSEDSGSKARSYLDGLLKIPFGIYKSEPILNIIKDLNETKEKINDNLSESDNNILNVVATTLEDKKRTELVNIIIQLNIFIKQQGGKKMVHSGKKIHFLKEQIFAFLKNLFVTNKSQFSQLCKIIVPQHVESLEHNKKLYKNVELLEDKKKSSFEYIDNVLDNAVHGHSRAKKQIKRIIGQWMNGEQTGYSFGFEGPPGVGKTSLAKKGLAQCLKDEDDNDRPFGFIAIGGSSHGSVLDGHNYTYVGSTWGRIVDILMESKCMNPIIFIDELDKVSRTEHGKEIIGILTHLTDQTQNEEFQDKYFNGIDIDLSRALFIFSYNDVNSIDRILLDRIHRIKFDPLSVEDKLVVVNSHILPELFKRTGMSKDIISLDDDIITFLIEHYTSEPGVRKLKEILYEIISDINLEYIQGGLDGKTLPISVSEADIIENYLKDRRQVKPKLIHKEPCIGIMNGLWANSLGGGGIIPIEVQYFVTESLLNLKLTGKQGDVMKESMNVAKTLAFNLTPITRQKALLKRFKDTKLQGIHIHCPEGAVPKDGPSAGTAITVAIYSLFNNKKIKHNIAITGEMNLQGFVTAIGGLDLKILGGIKAGIKEFIYPDENQEDFDKFYDKLSDKSILDGITFHSVNHIQDVLPLVYV